VDNELRDIRDAARRALAGAFTLEDLKASDTVPADLVLKLWQVAIDAGWTGLLVPEEAGGLGLGMVAAVVVAEELGEALAPGAWAETLALAPCLDLGSDALAALAEGAMRISLCSARGMSAGAESQGLVAHARSATHILALKGRRADAGAFILLAADEAQVLQDHQPLDPGTPVSTVGFTLPATEVAPEWRGKACEAFRLFVAAELIGVARGALSRSLDHARTRTQFGAPIGSFQAIKHRLADVAVALDSAALAVSFAARSWDQQAESATIDILAAWELAAAAANTATAAGIQIHGAIGVSWEHDLHLYLKRSHALQAPLRSHSSRSELIERLIETR